MTGHIAPPAPSIARLIGAWLFVGIPFAYGVYQVVVKALVLLRAGR
ncbi:MAG: hypothetical protein ABJD07_10525 [Gemmatimonadaceae bacterium]